MSALPLQGQVTLNTIGLERARPGIASSQLFTKPQDSPFPQQGLQDPGVPAGNRRGQGSGASGNPSASSWSSLVTTPLAYLGQLPLGLGFPTCKRPGSERQASLCGEPGNPTNWVLLRLPVETGGREGLAPPGPWRQRSIEAEAGNQGAGSQVPAGSASGRQAPRT